MTFLPFAILACTGVASLDMATPAERAAELLAQKSRMKTTYSLKLRIESSTPTAKPPLEKAWSSSLHIWRDGKKFRVDHFDAKYDPPRKGDIEGSRHVTCENCEIEGIKGYGIATTIRDDPTKELHMVEFRRPNHPLGFDLYCTHFDWRFFGLLNAEPCGYLKESVPSRIKSFFNFDRLQMRNEQRNGLPCIVATKSVPIYEQSMWLSESHAYNPIFIKEVFQLDDGPETRTTELTWQQTAGGHYYPKVVKHNTIASYGTTKHAIEKVITVVHADFDSPIDPTVFTLAGLGLNENQAIGLPGYKSGEQPIWRNGKIDYSYTVNDQIAEKMKNQPASSSGPPLPAPPPPYPTQGNFVTIIAIVAASLAAATLAAALVIRRRRLAE